MQKARSFPLETKMLSRCAEGIDAALAILDDGKPPLSKKTRIRARKPPRKGGRQMMQKLAVICRRHGITVVGKMKVEDIEQNLEEVRAMETILSHARDLLTKAEDTRFDAETTAWGVALPMYAVLTRLAATDAAIESDLEAESVTSFFARPHTKKSARAAAAAAAAAATAATPTPTSTSTWGQVSADD